MSGNKSVETKERVLFNQISEQYARKDILPASAAARRFLLSQLIRGLPDDIPRDKTVVDIGCGIGAAAKYLSGYYHRYIGIDQSEKMIETARHFHSDPRVQFIAGNIKESSQLPANTADLILSIGALHHMTHLTKVLKSLNHLAKPGAYLLAIEPHRGNPLIGLARLLRKQLDPAYSRDQVFFSEEEMVTLLQQNHITFLKSDFIGFFSTPFAELVLHPQQLFLPLSRLAIRLDNCCHGCLPKFLKRMSFKMAIYGQFYR